MALHKKGVIGDQTAISILGSTLFIFLSVTIILFASRGNALAGQEKQTNIDSNSDLVQYLRSTLVISDYGFFSWSKEGLSKSFIKDRTKISDLIIFNDPRMVEIKDLDEKASKENIRALLSSETILFFDELYGKNNWEIRIYYPDNKDYYPIGELSNKKSTLSFDAMLPALDGKIIKVFLVINQ